MLSTAADPEIDSLIYKGFLKTERRQNHTAVEDAVACAPVGPDLVARFPPMDDAPFSGRGSRAVTTP